MRFDLDADQSLFRETTARFLDGEVPVDELRRKRDDPGGFDPAYWRQGAELGWTSLLVHQDAGGGSIGEHGLEDLTLVAYEMGWHAAPGPLATVNVVAATLAHHDPGHPLLPDVLSGEAIVSWALQEDPPHDQLGDEQLTVRIEGDEVVVDGHKRAVESADRATALLVTGRTDGERTQVLVPTDAPGVSMTPMSSVDLTRRFSSVRFDQVRLRADAVVGTVGGAEADVERQLQQALVLATTESVGAMQRGFDLTLEWAFDRYTFGRPLASYQAIKHRFADMCSWLEASHAISDAAARAVAHQTDDAGIVASTALAYVGHHGSELLQECVQLHGGIGVTYEHDLHLFLRRHTLDRTLYGTPSEHRRRVAVLTAGVEEAAA